MHINICVKNKEIWENHPTYNNAKLNEDVGLDIPIHEEVCVPAKSKAFKIKLGIFTEPNHGYMLVPRSSIIKTPLRLSNSVGIIDKSFRGELMAVVDNISCSDFIIEKSKCYFQIVAFDGNLPTYTICQNLNNTNRGTGGFGSTTN